MDDLTLNLPLEGGQADQNKRRCRICGDHKPLDEFEHREYGRRRTRCKSCANAGNRRRYKENPAYKAYLYDWNNRNRDKRRQYSRDTYLKSRKHLLSWLSKTFHAIRKRDPGCTLTRFDAVELYESQGGHCLLTGRELLWGEATAIKAGELRPKHGVHRDALSIDRIDQSRGYMRDNVRLVTYQANFARNSYSDEELYAFCEAVLAARDARSRAEISP